MQPLSVPQSQASPDVSSPLREALSGVEQFRSVSELFALLGDATRIRIFWLLCHCEDCVINIAATLEMSSPAVSHHLRALRSTGLIIGRREGKEVFYRAAETETAELLHHMIEEVMCITCPEEGLRLSEYRSEREILAERVHDHLLSHLSERLTIEELAREFRTNPTTLKDAFKAVYGNSLAAHIKEHRIEAAAELLRSSELSVQEISRRVGYDSQSRFSAAFKEQYQMLPTEYRVVSAAVLSDGACLECHSHHRRPAE
ncbi:MAG: metalloregulator ArsR/SmtB family transcription factor [Oscillospiraceae bacterium]|nr:metalloregulator ArsR/SmtB family transcription factor [Oscillospiraceae bacterium]